MEVTEINLIDNNNEEMIMPGQHDISSNKELMSSGTEEAISGDYVDEALIKKEDTISLPNFVIDLGNIAEMTPNQMSAISSLLTYKLEESDTYVYMCTQKGIFHLGMSNRNKIDSLIAMLIHRTLGDDVKVYRNATESQAGELVVINDITKVRLGL